jgi:hypothetical protein
VCCPRRLNLWNTDGATELENENAITCQILSFLRDAVHIVDHALTASYSTMQRQSAGRLVESKDTDSADAMIVRMSIDDRGYSMLHVELIHILSAFVGTVSPFISSARTPNPRERRSLF